MLWPTIVFILAVALVVLNARWRDRLLAAEKKSAALLKATNEEHERNRLRIERQQAAMLNGMTEGLMLLDPHGRVQLSNRALASLFGIADDIQSRPLMEALRRHELGELVKSLGRDNPLATTEIRITHPTERWLEVNAALVPDTSGTGPGVVLVFHDVTGLKNVERARKDFVANVSHELRTPLSLIKGFVETLLNGAVNNPDVSEKFLRTIDRNAERLRLLMEDLLTISKLESGRLRIQIEPVSLPDMVDKVISDLTPKAAARGTGLRYEIPALVVAADPTRLEQVLFNLIDNAIKYGGSSGHVLISARLTENQFVECSVTDDGPGIPADALENVFERFYRVDKARSREQGGTGLGLSIVKHIIQSHEGRVWATSEPGKGSTFFFTLPLAPDLDLEDPPAP
ncbi:MAG: ATP-binding protein [Verrucomicrobiota bacterium]|jgi:two-component system phosphate regulon sensor histidine kinase PhoR|nr:ATP-binding protein [Verrucomicrobiota bacterium]